MYSHPPVAIVFDMDECIGTWSYAGILYSLFQYIDVERGKRARYLYTKHFLTKIFRPGFGKCLKLLKKYKNMGMINDVIIYTSNTGVGYPEFIIKCLEQYSNTPNLFTRVFVTHKKGESDNHNYKNLKVLTKYINKKYKQPFNNVLCFDDRLEVWSPKNGSRKRVIQVPVFTGDPHISLIDIINDISRYYPDKDLHSTLSKHIGLITYYTKTPTKIHNTNLYYLFNNFHNHRGVYPNYNDKIVEEIMINNINKYLNKIYKYDISLARLKVNKIINSQKFSRYKYLICGILQTYIRSNQY